MQNSPKSDNTKFDYFTIECLRKYEFISLFPKKEYVDLILLIKSGKQKDFYKVLLFLSIILTYIYSEKKLH